MLPGLTPRQACAFDAIVALTKRTRLSRSLAEIGKAIGVPTRSAVHNLCRALKARGYIDFIPRKQRSIVVLYDGAAATPGYRLDPQLQRRLDDYCAAHGERAADVVHDAVALLLGQMAYVERFELAASEARP
jgi:SOS-response transcriptional repressor LexA